MHNNFCRVLALVNCCWVSYNLQVFTSLYRGMKDTLMFASASKRVVVGVDHYQWSVAWFGYSPKREQFQIYFLFGEQPA